VTSSGTFSGDRGMGVFLGRGLKKIAESLKKIFQLFTISTEKL